MTTRYFPFDIFFYNDHELVHQLNSDIIIKRSERIISKIETFKALLTILKDQGDSDKLIDLAHEAIDLVEKVSFILVSRRKTANYWRNTDTLAKYDHVHCQKLINFIRAIYTDNHTKLPDILLSCNECKTETRLESTSITEDTRTSSTSKETTTDELATAEIECNSKKSHTKPFIIINHIKRKSKILFEVINHGRREMRDNDIIHEKPKELQIYMKNLHNTNRIRLRNLCFADSRLYEFYKKLKR